MHTVDRFTRVVLDASGSLSAQEWTTMLAGLVVFTYLLVIFGGKARP